MAGDRGRGRRTATVRFRITALASVAVAVVLVVTAVGLVAVQRRALTDSLDESLAAEARAIADDAAAPGGPGPDLDPPAIDDDAVAQVVVDGEVVEASRPDLRQQPLAPPPEGTTAVHTVDSVPGGDGAFRVASRRVASRRVERSDGAPAVVHVAAPLDDVAEATALLARSLALAVPAVTALLAALVWALAGRTLRPVEAIRGEVARIGATDLRRRVPEPPGDDEIARLARTMNAMLDRVEDAAERQRRFVDDASHELRTPLARVRAEIEVDLRHPGRADLAATHRSVLDETVGMQHLVDDLLHLARADTARETGSPAPDGGAAPARLDLLVAAEVRDARARAPVALDAPSLAPVTVAGDTAELRRAVANLLDNATRHARSHVVVALAADDGAASGTASDGTVGDATVGDATVGDATVGDGSVELAVEDDGPGVPADQAERIFERFARVDDARSAGDGGTGLGLAIAREIVERHGGRLTLDRHHRGGARFVMRLPGRRAGEAADRP